MSPVRFVHSHSLSKPNWYCKSIHCEYIFNIFFSCFFSSFFLFCGDILCDATWLKNSVCLCFGHCFSQNHYNLVDIKRFGLWYVICWEHIVRQVHLYPLHTHIQITEFDRNDLIFHPLAYGLLWSTLEHRTDILRGVYACNFMRIGNQIHVKCVPSMYS